MNLLFEQLRLTLQRPARLRHLFNQRIRRKFFGYLRQRAQWRETEWPGLLRRQYPGGKAEYEAHQSSKLALLDLAAHHTTLRKTLADRLGDQRGNRVLCLGARTGAECLAFIDRGADAIGIDLEPGPDNPLVKKGDFHNLQFSDRSMDVIYTNSLDHVRDLRIVLAEVRRVLKPDGLFMVEAASATQVKPGKYESFWWKTDEALIAAIESLGFRRLAVRAMTIPYPGNSIVFERLT